MTVLGILIPISVGLGLLGLVAFLWALKNNQYEDLEGDQARVLVVRSSVVTDAIDSTEASGEPREAMIGCYVRCKTAT